jgi:hypothetical protein
MPSLYEATANTGEVSSSNFTTLYNASGLQVPNAGAGQITGNLNVGGNLTVQGSSLLIGEVTLQSTLSLPNYTFPLPDGTTDQVLVTDGNGNLYWTDVSAIPGADYNISATTVTGGANLTLANTAGFTDSVKFAAGTNMSIVRTDANTITISTVADNIPDGTAQGQVLYWNGSAWVASSNVASSAANDRLVLQYNNSGAGTNTALFLRKNYGATNYSEANNDGVGLNYSVTSTAQGISSYGVLNFEYSATDPQFVISSSTDNFANSAELLILQKSKADFYAPNITLNATQTGAPSLNATITAERGSSTNATLTWDESQDRWEFSNPLEVQGQITGTSNLDLNGNTITLLSGTSGAPSSNAQIIIDRGSSTDATITWDETDDRWELNNDLLATGLQGGNVQIAMTGLADNEIFIGGSDLLLNTASGANNIQSNSPIRTTAQSMSINSDATNADSFLYMKGSTEYLRWDDGLVPGQPTPRFELSDQLFISQTQTPAFLERRNLTSEINAPLEWQSAIKLSERITDAANNNTVVAGPGITFARTSGANDTTERTFAGLGALWDGSTGLVNWQFNWTDDNYDEPTPGNFPGTYTLLQMGSNNAEFNNDSLFVNYAAQGITRTATSITGGNTLVFGVAHGYTAGQRIQYTSTTQNGLTQNIYYYVMTAGLTSTQCQLSLTRNGTAVALTNGTGLTLNFADLVNRVGVNMNNPAYTLDVNGDAHVSTDLTVDGDIYVSGVHVDLTTPVQQGQLLFVSDESPATITNSSLIQWTNSANRPNFQGDNGIYGRAQSGVTVSNNTGAVNYTTGDGSGIIVAVDSDGQNPAFIGSLNAVYNTSGDHEIRLTTSTNNFASDDATSITGSNTLVFPTAHGFSIGDKLSYAGPTQNGLVYGTTYYVISAGFTTTQCQVSLTLGGSAVALTNGTGLALWFFNGSNRVLSATNATVEINAPTLIFNATNTGIAGVSAGLEVERGTSGPNTTFIWNETNDRWEASTDFFAQQATIGNIDINRNNGQIDTNSGFNLTLDSDGGTVLINDNLNVDAGVLYVDATNNRVGVNTVTPAYPLDVNGVINTNSSVLCSEVTIDTIATINTQTTTTTATTITTISGTTRNSQKVVINIIDNVSGEVHILEALAVLKGTTAYLTTYAEMYSLAALATFTADVSGGFLRIRATPASANSTTFNVVRTSLD